MPDSLALRKKRLLYRSRYRGTQELDILVGGYVAAHVADAGESEIARLEALLDTDETVLMACLMGQIPVPDGVDGALVAAMRAFRAQQAQAQQ